MRRILLALTALALTVPAAEAARRDNAPTQASRPATQAAPKAPAAQAPARQAAPRQATTRQATTRATTTSQAPRQASRQPAARQASGSRQAATRVPARPGDMRTSSSGVLVRGAAAATVSREAAAGSCTRRNGRTVCGGAPRSSVAGWQSGLMPVDYAQRECPDGTFATLARGHQNVVRCMPI